MTNTASQPSAVLHLSESIQDLTRALRNAADLGEAFPGIRVHIVINGAAVNGLADLGALELPANTQISACAIALKNNDVDRSALPEQIDVVPHAPGAIVGAQLDGAAYMRL